MAENFEQVVAIDAAAWSRRIGRAGARLGSEGCAQARLIGAVKANRKCSMSMRRVSSFSSL